MRVERSEVFATFRPWLDARGYTPDRIAAVDRLCDRIPIAANDDKPVPSAMVPPAASRLAELGPQTFAIAAIDAALLQLACPENVAAELAGWAPALIRACRCWGIDTIREVASFLANIGVESRGLTRLEENLNYSAKRLTEVWPKRFPTLAAAAPYAGAPEKLANFVYANRMGNGPPASGDGWRYRGFGPKQLTGADNQGRFAKAAGILLQDVPAFVRTRDGGAMSAGWFWFDAGMDALAATPGVADDRQRINGGQTGVGEVERRFNLLVAELLRRELSRPA